MAGQSDSGHLSALLGQLETVWRSAGDPGVDRLAPGLHKEETDTLLATIGLTPPEELREWFGWHNGITDGLSFSIPHGPDLVSLADAISHYRMLRGIAVDVHLDFGVTAEVLWPQTVFPFAPHEYSLVIDCRVDAPEPRPVWTANYADARNGNGRGATSLAAAVETWLSLYEDGYVWWNGYAWESREWTSFPLSLRASGILY